MSWIAPVRWLREQWHIFVHSFSNCHFVFRSCCDCATTSHLQSASLSCSFVFAVILVFGLSTLTSTLVIFLVFTLLFLSICIRARVLHIHIWLAWRLNSILFSVVFTVSLHLYLSTDCEKGSRKTLWLNAKLLSRMRTCPRTCNKTPLTAQVRRSRSTTLRRTLRYVHCPSFLWHSFKSRCCCGFLETLFVSSPPSTSSFYLSLNSLWNLTFF